MDEKNREVETVFNTQRDYYSESVKGLDVPMLEVESVTQIFVDGEDVEEESVWIKSQARTKGATKRWSGKKGVSGWLEMAQKSGGELTKSKLTLCRHLN